MKLTLLVSLFISLSASAANTARSPFDLEIPPPETTYPPVLKHLPGSLPQYQTLAVPVEFDESNMLDKGLLYLGSKIRPREVIRVFATDGSVQSLGEMLEPEDETGLPMNFQYIFVKIKKGEARMLDKLLIVKDRGPLQKIQKGTKDLVVKGNLVQIKAEIQLTSLVESAKPDPVYDYYRARVLKAVSLSGAGDLLIKGQLQTTESTTQGPRNGIIADIIGGENEERSGLYGQGEFVILNKGADDGVKVGDILPLFINRMLRNVKTPIVESTVSQGLLKVVHVDDGVATALVVQADTGIRQGDKTGALARNDHVEEGESSVEDFDLSE